MNQKEPTLRIMEINLKQRINVSVLIAINTVYISLIKLRSVATLFYYT